MHATDDDDDEVNKVGNVYSAVSNKGCITKASHHNCPVAQVKF